jgi:DNA polymerase
MIHDGQTTDFQALEALLDWYAAAGIDLAVDEEPHDRFAEAAAAPAVSQAPAGVPAAAPRALPSRPLAPEPGPASLPAPDAAATDARSLAAAARTLDELREAMRRFEGCALRQTATQLVFADGNPEARVMLVGEAPGRDEDEQGLPFVGRSGRLLDRMLAAIGLDRSSVYIANVVPWRPPGNRTPTPQETAICLPFIARQIALSRAEVLVCLGGPAAQTLLSQKDGILKTRGRWFSYTAGERTLAAMPTLHPAYLLRQPAQKRLAWRDFCALKARLG